MQHQTIEADRDPDLDQAREDMAPRASRIRELSLQMLSRDVGSRIRAAAESEIQNQMSFILVRADRIGIAPDALMAVLNADLDAKARRGRPAPTRDTSRTLLAEHEQAQARLRESREQEKAWGSRVEQDLAALAATEEAIKALGARGLK